MEKSKKILGLAPNVISFGLISLFNDLSAGMVQSVMPIFLTAVLGAPAVFIGFIEGFADAVGSFSQILFGWLSDKLKRRKILAVCGYSLANFTRLVMALVTNFWQVLVLRAFDRTGKGMRDAPRDALLTESADHEALGRSFNFNRAMDALGATLGPLAALIILPLIAYNHRQLFIGAFLVGVLSIAAFLFIKEKRTDIQSAETGSCQMSFRFSWGNLDSSPKSFLAAFFIFSLGVFPMALMVLRSKDFGLNSAFIPLLYFVYNLSFSCFAIPVGRWSDKIGERRVLTFGFLIAIAVYLGLIYIRSSLGLILSFIIFGIFAAMTDGIGRALMSKLVPRERLATAQGFLGAAGGISSLLAGLIGGAIWTVFGSTMAFIYGTVMMFIGLVLFVGLNGLKKT